MLILSPRRELYSGWGDGAGWKGLIYQLHMWLPAIAWLMASDNLFRPSIQRHLHRLATPGLIVPLALLALTVFNILAFLRVPGLWWTWETVSLHGIVALLAYILSGGGLRGVALGLGIYALTAGAWELVYHAGYAWNYPEDLEVITGVVFFRTITSDSPLWYVTSQVFKLWPMYVSGGLILYAYRSHLKAHIDTKVLLLLCSLCFLFWFVSGFWVDIRWDSASQQWYRTTGEPGYAMAVYKASKVFLGLAALSLLWKPGWLVRTAYSYSLIPFWLFLFAASSFVLFVTWLKSFTAPKYETYFLTRSIYNGRALGDKAETRKHLMKRKKS